ncbi:MAG: protein kinase [Deltaproteobacteria bacterium]|nr:protein kinase [Myxococcales bacterium]MDP3217380.1 protein kinase [Deltaproteobacteria bacterium]
MGEFTMLPTGTMVSNRYRIRKVLGKGGMGAVYQAEDTQTSTKVALKTLRVDLYEREDLVKRFEREARAAARIGHPSIVGVHAVGHDDALRTRFIVQEELRGTDVAGCLNELGSLSPLSAIAVALPVMDALIAAHAAGIVHRDIKPENVFLHEMDDGTIVPKVIDFGIAKVIDVLDRMERTATGMVFGTPWYMSPEQALGDSSIDARTDVWSVGAMIYEMVCGTLPFGGTNPNAVMAQIIFGRPTPLQHHWPDVPADLQEVIHKAIERDLHKRYATMQEFHDALIGCALWRDVTPEIAQGFLPRPSSFEGISDILPAEFMDDPADRSRSRQPSRPSAEARRRRESEPFDPRPVVFTANPEPIPTSAGRLAEPGSRSVKLSLDEERIPTRPMPADRALAALPACAEAEIGTELPLSVPPMRAPLLPGDLPSHTSQRRQRVEFDTLRPSSWGRGRPSRLVSGVGVALTLFCGAVLAVGLVHWIQRPQPAMLAASASSYAVPAALGVEARPQPAEQELPRAIPEVRAPERDRTIVSTQR